MTFDPLVEERTASGGVVQRDQGDPLIVPRGGTEAIKYDRASALSDYLAKNIYGIKKWEQRYLAIGLGRRPDLAALAGVETYTTGLGHVRSLTTPAENKASGARLDEIIERALDASGIHEKADTGTVIHAGTDQGTQGVVPADYRWMVEAYHELTAALTTMATEVFVACDELKTAGTFDHAYWIEDQELARQLSDTLGIQLHGVMIGDKKTGKNMHVGDFEIQLGGTYAHGEVYLGPPIDGVDQRIRLHEYFGVNVSEINTRTGLIVHIPTEGKPKPRVLPINLERGYRLAKQAAIVRDARNELDRIGIPKALGMDSIAARVMAGEFNKLLDEWDAVDKEAAHGLDDQALHLGAQALWQRFKHIWPQDYTTQVKERIG